MHYAKRHPWKVFLLVLMPLITGGALTALLARFGLRMPKSIENLLGLASKAVSGNSIGMVGDAVRMAGDFGGYGAQPSSMHYERNTKSYGGQDDGWGNGLMGMAKMFI